MSTKAITNRKDILLLLLYSPGVGDTPNEPVLGRTRLMKMLFLFKRELLPHFHRNVKITDDNFYAFFAWKFGPFSKEVYDDITFFELRGYLKRSPSKEDTLPESAEEWQEWLSCGDFSQEEQALAEYEEPELTLTPKGEQLARDVCFADFRPKAIFTNVQSSPSTSTLERHTEIRL